MPLYLLVVIISGIIGVPIVFALSFGPFVDYLSQGNMQQFGILVQQQFSGMNKFILLSVPLFILAGDLMNRGGITQRLVRFSQAMVGHFHGGLAQVNILSSILFAGLSGSAVADTSALGSILIPAMEEDGYPRDFSTAVTASSSIIGPIIPPEYYHDRIRLHHGGLNRRAFRGRSHPRGCHGIGLDGCNQTNRYKAGVSQS